MNVKKVSTKLADGREITIETGKLAKQAHGSVEVRLGDTVLLATVVSDYKANSEVDFLPLTVEYKEKYASTGRFPGGFFKREARPSDYEVLIMRLIDRALRPLFPDDYHASTVVSITLQSADKDVMPDTLACLAASAAIMVSDIPFNGPVSEVRVGKLDGKLVINPNQADIERLEIDMIVAASEKDIMMVEGEMNEVSEQDMAEAIAFAHEAIKLQCKVQKELEALVGKTVKREYCHEDKDEALYAKIKAFAYDKVQEVARNASDKDVRSTKFDEIKTALVETLTDEEKEKTFLIGQYYGKVKKEAVRRVILDESKRLDGRGLEDIRPIWTETNYLPSPHGSAVFTRGETQSLTTVTLGTKLDEQMIDGALFEGTRRFLLHYNFPSFSTGEARPERGTSRREVGHGNLALRALQKVVPADYDYTIRVVSDILESNGSSSMATVCAGSMALMDAGVKIKAPVSGIAMGLITDNKGNAAVLSDILGDEDHLGDMDFKVTGTEKGITACQMDIKIDGLTKELLIKALEQAKRGRLHILGEMNKTITTAREDFKPHVPRLVKFEVAKEFIGAIIGPGGKVIQEIQKATETVITIEEKGNVGIVEIFSNNKENLDKAYNRIKGIVTVPEIGEVYDATVKSIMPYGAFVEFLPGKQGLLHISEVSWSRLETLEGVLNEGDAIKVKLLEVDQKTGKFKLSRKVLMEKPQKQASENKEG